jgi:cell division transport system permease protein
MKHRRLKQFLNILSICFERLLQYRVANLVTVLLLTATLSLPALFWLVTANLNKVSHQWYSSTEVSAYLKPQAAATDIDSLINQLRKNPNIDQSRYISPEEGLKALSQQSNLASVLSSLPDNPLPGVIAIKLKPSDQLSEIAKNLQTTLSSYPIIDTVQVDSLWLQRLQTMLTTLKRLSGVLAVLLIIGGVLIVSNSIQLTLERHRHEIAIYQLVGANSVFIRAPFLIAGLLIGLTAGLLTWLTVGLILSWLTPNVNNLSALYQSSFQLTHFGFFQGLVLLLVSGALGTLGATVASRHYG